MSLKLYRKRERDQGVRFETKKSGRRIFPPERDVTKQTALAVEWDQ